MAVAVQGEPVCLSHSHTRTQWKHEKNDIFEIRLLFVTAYH